MYVCICMYMYIKPQMYYRVLAHVMMDAYKSHDLPSANWKPRKAGDVVQRHENQTADAVDSNLILKA